MTNPAAYICMPCSKSMVCRFVRFSTNRTRIPVGQESFFVGIMTTPARYSTVFIQRYRSGSSIGSSYIFYELLDGQIHLRLDFISRDIPFHFFGRNQIQMVVSIVFWIIDFSRMTITTYMGSIPTKNRCGCILKDGICIRRAQMTP